MNDNIQNNTEKTILIIDDEEHILKLSVKILSKYGYKVISSNNTENALTLYKNNIGQISIVILDMFMPGMTWQQTLGKLIDINSKIKVLLSSGFSEAIEKEETKKYGAFGFLAKPYSISQLIDIIEKGDSTK
ncbi:MAG: response regulator [Candidatus Theseobacter exili]|nr:response regulator [Candidatus Theseobacter exili]